MIKKWKKLSSKQVFSHSRHNVFIDQVELPNGKITEYIHFGEELDAAMVLARREDGKFLLQKEYSYPPDEIMLQCPGGLLDEGESPEAGALRELSEEAGLKGDLQPLGWIYINNRRKSNKMHFFLATNLEKVEAKPDEEEDFEDYWYSEAEIMELITTNELRNYTALCGWSFYLAFKQKGGV